MIGYEWKPDLVFHSVCPRGSNLHALEVPASRIIVFTAETCLWSRAERADQRMAELEADYRRIIKEVLACNPRAASGRPDDELEPPWEVIARIRRERDGARHALLHVECRYEGDRGDKAEAWWPEWICDEIAAARVAEESQ